MIYPGAMEYVSPVLASLNAFLENPENPMVGLVESIVSNAGDRPVSLLLKDFGAIHGCLLYTSQDGQFHQILLVCVQFPPVTASLLFSYMRNS